MLLLLHAEHVDKGACLPYQLFTPFTPYNIQSSPYFDPTHTRTGWIGQPPILNRHEVVTIDGDVVTLRQATPSFERARRGDRGLNSGQSEPFTAATSTHSTTRWYLHAVISEDLG